MRLPSKRCLKPLFSLSFLTFLLAVAVAESAPDRTRSDKQPIARSSGGRTTTALEATSSAIGAKIKADLGTKDAPVDGKDGKPHAGPWVEAGLEGQTLKGHEKGGSADKKPAPRPLTAPALPEVNDGVMDDPNRAGPKKGTTGTEGGVSEKTRGHKALEALKGDTGGKTPDPPKAARPLPHSEEERIKGIAGDKKDVGPAAETDFGDDDDGVTQRVGDLAALGGLAKPTDLPPKTHDSLPPSPPSSRRGRLGPLRPGPTLKAPGPSSAGGGNGLLQPLHSLLLSFTMILFSEVGDKTFLVAALMAMKHPRLLVFSAALCALIAMTILSAILGHAVPTLIPRRFTNVAAGLLFLVFGGKLLRDGYRMRPEENAREELKEVEMELEEQEQRARKHAPHPPASISPYALEAGRAGTGTRQARSSSRLPSAPRSPSLSSSSRSASPDATSPASSSLSARVRSGLAGLNNLFSFLLSPAWVQTFVLTFLGEWGDRSQIATIAMAAGPDYWWVTAGAVTGHAICTAAAVLGGRALAGRVSLRMVTLGGAIAFLTFSFIYLAEAVYYP
ncbi:MAG: hypothetical protein M1826_005770 [Phylliscum demangeonii]|nr:MAG: hypothetical protein M1826_005770 [Phylliscum demangeonii]